MAAAEASTEAAEAEEAATATTTAEEAAAGTGVGRGEVTTTVEVRGAVTPTVPPATTGKAVFPGEPFGTCCGGTRWHTQLY